MQCKYIYLLKRIGLKYHRDNSSQTRNILLFNVYPFCSFVHLPTTRNNIQGEPLRFTDYIINCRQFVYELTFRFRRTLSDSVVSLFTITVMKLGKISNMASASKRDHIVALMQAGLKNKDAAKKLTVS